jgi:hypothetical protein
MPSEGDAPSRPVAALLAPLFRAKFLLALLTIVGAVSGYLVARFAPPSHTARVTIRKLRPEDDPFEVLRTASQFERIVRAADAAAAAIAAAPAHAAGADPVRVAALVRVHASTIAHCMELTLALPDPAAAVAIARALAETGIERVHAARAAAMDDASRALAELVAARARDLDAADARSLAWRRANGYPLAVPEAERLFAAKADLESSLAEARRERAVEEAAAGKLSELLRAEPQFIAPQDGESGSASQRRIDRVPNPAHTHLMTSIDDSIVREHALAMRIRLLEDEAGATRAAARDASERLPSLEIERDRIDLDRTLAQEAYAGAVAERDAGAAHREAGSRELEIIDVAPPFRGDAAMPGAAASAFAGALLGFAIAAFAAVLKSYAVAKPPAAAPR